jgi:hypothetical protein
MLGSWNGISLQESTLWIIILLKVNIWPSASWKPFELSLANASAILTDDIQLDSCFTLRETHSKGFFKVVLYSAASTVSLKTIICRQRKIHYTRYAKLAAAYEKYHYCLKSRRLFSSAPHRQIFKDFRRKSKQRKITNFVNQNHPHCCSCWSRTINIDIVYNAVWCPTLR